MNETLIRIIVRTSVVQFANGFSSRHLHEIDDPDGTINMKIHNPFIVALGADIQYYSSLARSLDSSLGNMLEAMALEIAMHSYDIERHVTGVLYEAQTSEIARLLESYRSRTKTPRVTDYQALRQMVDGSQAQKRHESDYLLRSRTNGDCFLIELKIGGDLDNKKARSEKEALLEQYAILCNSEPNATVHVRFATAYNRYGDGRPWAQTRVLQFFAPDELLIGRDFWNFITLLDNGYDIVLDEYKRNADTIIEHLKKVREAYLVD